MAAAGFATPDWVVLPHSTFRELGARAVLDAMVERLGLPMMLKPDQGGSALGAQVVRDAADLPAAMVGCFAYGDTVLAEKFIDGVEVAVAVVDGPDGPEALPAVEIVPESGVYDYTARYTAGLTDFHAPARLDAAAATAAGRARRRRAPACSGCATSRAPTRSSRRTARVHFLEVNSVARTDRDLDCCRWPIETAGDRSATSTRRLIERAIERTSRERPFRSSERPLSVGSITVT